MKLRSKKALVLGGAVVLGMLGVTAAIAGLTQSPSFDGPARVRIVQSEFTPDATTPTFVSDWHVHPGPAIVQVTDGAFKIYQGGCSPTVVQSGETFIEVPGVPVKAVAFGAVAWTTTLVLPDTSPPVAAATPVANPGC